MRGCDVYVYVQCVCTMSISHKKEWNNAICSNMEGPKDYYTKWSKSERERQIPFDITYMWNLKHDIDEFVYEIDLDIENKLMVTKGKTEERDKLGAWDYQIKTIIYIYIYIS